MFTITSKIRRTVAVLVASLGVAAATGPLVSAAQALPPSNGGNKTGTQLPFTDAQCAALYDEWHSDIWAADSAYNYGDIWTWMQLGQEGQKVKAYAAQNGCAVGSWSGPPYVSIFGADGHYLIGLG